MDRKPYKKAMKTNRNQPVTGSFRMKYIRSLFLPLLLLSLLFAVTADTARADVDSVTAVTYVDRADTIAINAGATNVQVLAFEVANNGAGIDVLQHMTIHSYNGHAFSVQSYKIYQVVQGTGTQALKTSQVFTNNPFQTGEEYTFLNVNIQIAAGNTDTVIVKMDALTDSVNARPLEFDGEGVQIGVPVDGLTFLSGASLPTSELIPTDFDPGPPDPSGYWIRFDTSPPLIDSITVYKLDDYYGSWGEENVGGYECTTQVSPDPFALGDSIRLQVWFNTSQNLDSIKANSVKIKKDNWDAFRIYSQSSADVLMGWHVDSTFAWYNYRIPMPLPNRSSASDWKAVRTPVDFSTDYPLVFEAADSAGNVVVDTLYFDSEVDTKKPLFDSVTVGLSYDAFGDGCMTVGDTISITAWMTGNRPFEVQHVKANLSNFLPLGSDTLIALHDVIPPNNSTIWRVKVGLDGIRTDRDLEAGSTNADTLKMKTIWLMAWDDVCNPETTHVTWDGCVDLDPPQFGAVQEYKAIANNDTNICVDFGDEVRVRVSIPDDPAVDSVFCDLTDAGLNRNSKAALYDDGTNGDATANDKIWTLDYTIGDKWEVTPSDPLPQYAKDANGDTPPPNDADYSIWVYATDVHGNRDSVKLGLVDVDDDPGTLDTKRPHQIPANSLFARALGGVYAGQVQLYWAASDVAADAALFHVYEVTGGDWGDPATDEVGAAGTDICWTDTMCWQSEEYEDGQALTFGVRTEDDCGNWEFNNTALVSVVADAKAPTACVVYPEPPDNGTYGPGNLLNITAVVGPDVSGLESAWMVYRLTDIGNGNPGPWENMNGTDPDFDMDIQGVTLYGTVDLGTDAATAGDYQLYILTRDKVGNVLTLAEAQAACDALEFSWFPEGITTYFADINGNVSPNLPGCGFEVYRDQINEATVSVLDADAGAVYSINAWVIWYKVAHGDTLVNRTRIEYESNIELPYTFEFSVTDWPKTLAGDYPTNLYVEITDTRNGSRDTEVAKLCVPDEAAPEVCMTYPSNYERVHIAHSDLDYVPLRAEVLESSYDPQYPIRCEFFYYLDTIDDAVKIGESGDYSHNYFEVEWDNSDMSEGWVWLFSVVHDDFDNVDTSCAIKVYLDNTAPFMEISAEPMMWYCDSYQLSTELNGGYVDLTANIVPGDSTIDIARVMFFVGSKDSVDVAYTYHLIGAASPANNSTLWTYHWDMADWVREPDDDFTLQCWNSYKLRIWVVDVAGNVYDDSDGDKKLDDYTFWDDPVEMNAPADPSKMLFTLHCGAPQVAVSQFATDDYTFETPSEILDGSGVVFAKKDQPLTVQSVALSDCQLECCVDIDHVNYYFYSPVIGGYKLVETSSDADSAYQVTFDPWAMGLITLDDVRINGYHGHLKAELVDKMGATTDDVIDLWMLDNVPGQAIFMNPTPGACVWNTVHLQLLAINGDTFKKVVYKISDDGGETWTDLATVYAGDADSYFTADWPTMTYADGEYMLGFEVTDQNDNVTDVDGNQQIAVNVNNALPTVTITAPEGSDTTFANPPTFVGEGEWFSASVSSTDIQWVQFQFKEITDPVSSFEDFDESADRFPPWESYWSCYEGCSDGYYHFRAVAKNSCGRTVYSPWIMAYNDATSPYAELITVNGYDAEAQNELPCFSVGDDVTFEVAAFDTLAESGINSGVSMIKVFISTSGSPNSYNEVFSTAAGDGITTFNWATSGLASGTYHLVIKAYDGVYNVGSTVDRTICFEDACAPVALVAGFKHCMVFGLSEASATVQFQYSQDDGSTWIPIGIASREDTKWLDVQTCDTCCGGHVNYGVFAADWKPADGDYWVRLVARDSNGNKTNGAPLPITVGDCEAFATGNPADFGDEHWIEKSWDSIEDCDLDGEAQFHSAYGMPWGISFEYNEQNEDYDFDILTFRATPQQGDPTMYAGAFDFDALVDNGGYGWQNVYFFDAADDGSVGYSVFDHIDAYWLTKNLGSGGMVTGQDGNVSVDVPPMFTNDRGGYDELLVLWESQLAPPGVYQDVFIQPIANPNGKMYFIGNPGCDGDICGHDERYATIKMAYDPTVDLSSDQLKVMYYDDGTWYDDDIFFPSTVEGFNTTDHTVEFATTCLNGFYSVVKVQQITNCYPVVREEIYPWCNGTYTGPRPSFAYRVPENFDNTIDWDYLMIKVDGVRIYTGYALEDGPTGKAAPQGTTLGEADGWDFEIDQEAARVYFHMHEYYDEDYNYYYYDYPPLACGQHVLDISVEDNQLREYCLSDTFMVDCTPPDVNFPNGYVSKNPAIEFSITDDESGVSWDDVHVDVFFVSKYDTTAGGPDYSNPKERVIFAQTFFPDQIKDYMVDANTARITTTYELDDEASILAVVYDGDRNADWYDGYYWDIDPGAYDQFDEFYSTGDGVYDCAWNTATPHMQYLAVDYDAPGIEKVSVGNTCPAVFKISEDGSGMMSTEIYEDGELLTMAASVADVTEGGDYYLEYDGGEGATLYYCPTGGTNYKIVLTDNVGNVRIYTSTGTVAIGTLGEAGIDAWNAPNPFDPSEGNTQIKFNLPEAARVTIKVYDLAGELVRTLKSDAHYSTGEGYATWDGKTDNDTRVSTGVYLVHVSAVGEESGTSASDVVKVAIVQK
jgi:hypothetical protein